MHKQIRVWLFILFVTGLAAIPILNDALANVRVRGSLGVKGYGYEDYGQNNHFWLMQATSFSVYQTDGPLSIHFSGGYIGDSEDEFSASGRGRFLKGYIGYGGITDDLQMRLGRNFLYNGVVIGVIDGLEVEKKLGKAYRLKVFGGMMGDKMSEFEFEEFDKAAAFGGEFSWFPTKLFNWKRSKLSLSYANQMRNNSALRRRIGLMGNTMLNDELRLLASLQVKPSESLLRKFICRLRYLKSDLRGLFEFGIYNPDTPDESWFSSAETPSRMRVRFAFDKYLIVNQWALGIEGTAILVKNTSGYRLGPVLTTPCGQVGYRMQLGDLSKSEGPWASLRYKPIPGYEAYASGSFTSYEWEEFEIEEENLITLLTGVRYTPFFYRQIVLFGEYQAYRTPQFTSDRRFLGGIKWKFDTGRTSG